MTADGGLDAPSGTRGSEQSTSSRLQGLPADRRNAFLRRLADSGVGRGDNWRLWSAGGEVPYPNLSLPRFLETPLAAVERRRAVTCGGVDLSYAELHRRADELARRLVARGVSPERRVAVFLPRSTELIVGLLAVAKSGGAWVPVDPTVPDARLHAIIDDAKPSIVLTTSELASRLGALADRRLELDVDGDATKSPTDANPLPEPDPANLAYLAYTSGSTGSPKGVLVEQRSVVNFATQIAAAYGMTPESRVLGFHSIGFDAGPIFEIVTTLSVGATLVLATDEERASVEGLERLIRKERVTVVELPPGMLALIDATALDTVALVSTGGEPVRARQIGCWLDPSRRIFNGYGPTEATVAVTLFECAAGLPDPVLGRPMANHNVYVLDPDLQPVDSGHVGEIHIAGIGVARGYEGRPAETAERFVPNPYSSNYGDRLYRTGDLARWREDGQLELVGRADRQVKISGVRTELAEVEHAALTYAGITAAAAEVASRHDGANVLVLFYTATGELDEDGLLDAIAALVPRQARPAFTVRLNAIPLKEQNKVDHAELRARAAAQVANRHDRGDDDYATDIERRVAREVVAPVIGHAPSRLADFFQVGGASLDAAAVVARARAEFDVAIGLGTFLREPTIAAFSSVIEGAIAEREIADRVIADLLDSVETTTTDDG